MSTPTTAIETVPTRELVSFWTDPFEEALDGMEIVGEQLERALRKPHAWKQVVLALQNSVQNFMICALKGSNPWAVFDFAQRKHTCSNCSHVTVYKDRGAEYRLRDKHKIDGIPLEELARDASLPPYILASLSKGKLPEWDEHLLSFRGLYERTKSLRFLPSLYGVKAWECPQKLDRSILSINRWRDKFAHFRPSHHGFGLFGLPEMVLDCLTYCRFLLFESNAIHVYGDNDHERAEALFAPVETAAKRLKKLFNKEWNDYLDGLRVKYGKLKTCHLLKRAREENQRRSDEFWENLGKEAEKAPTLDEFFKNIEDTPIQERGSGL